MKKTFLLSLIFLTAVAFEAYSEEPVPAPVEAAKEYKRSIQIGAGYAYSVHDTFGGLQSAYVPSAIYNYHISNDFLIGLVLGRFQHNAWAGEAMMQYQYGFTIGHLIPKSWIDMGDFQFLVKYGILLSQTWFPDRGPSSGRDLSHTTLLAIGGEGKLADQHRLGFELNWTYSMLPSLIVENESIMNVGAEIFYRYLF